ncbi:MAG: hypothetical protein E3J72_06805 [Planctomycetota bacterium]|nr:MAG: hypothetical protein E3J72_06805 [Planctomycetota bacterium]
MKDLHLITMIAAAAVILCPWLQLHAGENSGPVPKGQRESKAAELVAEMEANLKSQMKNKAGSNADFFPPTRKKVIARLKGNKSKLLRQLLLRHGRIKYSANLARKTFALELERVTSFVKNFQSRGEGAAKSDYRKKMKEIEGRPQRERHELGRKADEELRKELRRIQLGAAGIWSATSPGLWEDLEKHLRGLYDQLVETLKQLKNIGQKRTIPKFEEWGRTKKPTDPPDKDRRRRKRNPMEWEEPAEKPDPGKRPPKPRFPWPRKPGGK